MKFSKFLLIFGVALAMAASAAQPGWAAEARPWLCRDKPVFSSASAMEYRTSTRTAHSWRIFFMEFSPEAAHDGFEIVNSTTTLRESLPAGGNLEAGRYYAVAMYRDGERWICPGYAREDSAYTPGIVRKICYAENSRPCSVTLTVTPAQPRSSTGHAP
ncbi:MAG TPA: hypothetical protein VMT58_03165 [Candidatus Binataceae bacterium]|nr:hypothetical protein [Candidatus Binataceae bacterium]